MRVLVVEDYDDARELLGMLLAEAGAEVLLACNAAEGFALLPQAPDVIISDIGLPGEDGYSFVRRIRALPASSGGSIPVLALTAFSADRERARAEDAGFTAYLTKPVNPRALMVVMLALRPQARPSEDGPESA